ncbi:MAG: YfhO family protein [Verrucomicrobiia bacterium]
MNNDSVKLLQEADASRAKIFFLIAGFIILFFPTVIVGIDSFFYRDYGALGYPIIYYWKTSILSGELPFWNPLSHCGVPFIAQWGTMSLYPFSLIYLILPLPLGLNLFIFLHLIVGGAGMYLLAKKWIGKEYPSLLAGVGYIFNGAVLSCLMWANYVAAVCWIPWIIYSFETAILQGKKYLIYSIIFSVIQYLAGVPELVIITQFIVFCVFIITLPVTFNTIIRYIIILISPIILSAVQLLPFLHLYSNSHRLSMIDVNKWAMPGWGWANFFVPLFHYYETYQHTFIQTGQAFLTSYYFPLIFISLSLIGVLDFRNKRIAMLLVITLFSLIMSPGENGFLFPIISNLLPLSIKIRYPVKFILIVAFTIPLLAAYGLSKSEKKNANLILSTIVVLFIVCSVLLFNYKYQFEYDQFNITLKNAVVRLIILLVSVFIIIISFSKVRYRYLFYFLLILVAYDAEKHIPNFHPRLSSEYLTSKLWEESTRYKPLSISEGRVFISKEAEEKLLRSVVSDWSANFTGKRLAVWSNLNLLEHIPKVNGAFTLQIKYQKEIESALYSSDTRNISNMLRYLSVKYITLPGTVVEWTNYDESLPLITAGQSVAIMNDEQIKEMLFSDNYEPGSVVFISNIQRDKQPELKAIRSANVKIFNTNITNHKITIEYEADSESVLTIAQSYYPLWQAYMDGNKLSIMRANYAFQSVYLPQGRHYLVIKYEDKMFYIGFIVSILGIIGLITKLFYKSE